MFILENGVCSRGVLSYIYHRKLVFPNNLGDKLIHYDLTCLTHINSTHMKEVSWFS